MMHEFETFEYDEIDQLKDFLNEKSKEQGVIDVVVVNHTQTYDIIDHKHIYHYKVLIKISKLAPLGHDTPKDDGCKVTT